MNKIFIHHPDGRQLYNVSCRYLELSDRQQLVVIALDFDRMEHKFKTESIPGVEHLPIGKLKEQNAILQAQVVNSLKLQDWDFWASEDPELVLMTDTRKVN